MLAPKRSILLSLSVLMVSSVTSLLMTSVTGSLVSNMAFPKLDQRRRRPRNVMVVLPEGDLLVRGGSNEIVADETKELLRQYLQNGTTARKFQVQGWRWHTMSLAREAGRLQKLALRLETTGDEDLSNLSQAADYVVNFNLKALHRVEDMFFPWIRKQLDGSKMADAGMKTALGKVLDELVDDQQKLVALGNSITQSLKSKSTPPQQVARMVALQSGQIIDLSKSMLERELTMVIPTVGLCISEKEQKKFNNQVITFLGVFEARTHLVHMHEVVTAAESDLERELWKECIPSLPRSLIPRWKRTLYAPKSSMLDSP